MSAQFFAEHQVLRLRGQADPLIVGEPDSAASELLALHAVLLLQIVGCGTIRKVLIANGTHAPSSWKTSR